MDGIRALWVLAVVLGIACVARADDEIPPDDQPPPTRGTHGRFTASVHGGLLAPIRFDRVERLFVGGGLVLGFDTMFHPHHEVGFRVSESLDFAPSGGSRDPGHWIGIATDYRFHPELVVGEVVPYVEVAGGFGLYFGCLVGDSCGGLGMHGEAGAGIEIAVDDYASFHVGGQLRVLTGMLANGVSAVLQPALTLGVHAG